MCPSHRWIVAAACCLRDSLRGRHRRERVAKPVDCSTFHIHAPESGRGCKIALTPQGVAASVERRQCCAEKVSPLLAELRATTHAPARSIQAPRARPRGGRPQRDAGLRSWLFLQFLLQFLQQIQSLQRRQCVHIQRLNAVNNTLRQRSENRQLHRLRRSFHLDTLPFLLFMLL